MSGGPSSGIDMAAMHRSLAWVGSVAGIAVAGLILGHAAWGLASAAIVAGLTLAWAQTRIGGITGDVPGAIQQVSTLAVLVAVVA